ANPAVLLEVDFRFRGNDGNSRNWRQKKFALYGCPDDLASIVRMLAQVNAMYNSHFCGRGIRVQDLVQAFCEKPGGETGEDGNPTQDQRRN
ncbi:MAG: hypothetical protein RQ826_08025, partial [Xanthomonadales bacterium]|nr:hypothetical protein [Xanthomonadales bacterium]